MIRLSNKIKLIKQTKFALLQQQLLHTTQLSQATIKTNLSSTKNNYPIPNYEKLIFNLKNIQKRFENPKLTLTEKILLAHLRDLNSLDQLPKRGEDYLYLKPDRIAMQDASAQMAILQFLMSKKPSTAIPTSIHCDHLIAANLGAKEDLKESYKENQEIFEFLKASSIKLGIDFWGPGSGIIHQIVLENYASPGGLMLGTDSHTPNAGGLTQLSIGVGGADAVDGMADLPWELKMPKILGIHLKNELKPWATPKDLILYLVGKLSVRGGTGHVLEYFGDGINSLSCTGMATICNMGAEVGATTSLFPYTESMDQYLKSTQRNNLAKLLENIKKDYLKADEEVYNQPEKYYDEIIEIDLNLIEPMINGPFTPDLNHNLNQFKLYLNDNQINDQVKVGLIGSCTNSSYSDMFKVADLAQQALDNQIELPKGTELLITPGSEQIRATIERDGIIEKLNKLGGKVLANACGPCIGQWKRNTNSNNNDNSKKETNSIISSFNRNFKSRNDGNPNTMNFLASPEMVFLKTLSGKLSFDPRKDFILNKLGEKIYFKPPNSMDLPNLGFNLGDINYKPIPNPIPNPTQSIPIPPNSTRLELLKPFPKWNGEELNTLVLIKVEGKCTTDHISAAGPWLKYKGHLTNLSKNTLIGAKSKGTGKVNQVINQFTNEMNTIPEAAEDYKKRGQPWCVITDFNYGEGSAREHAAMQPRYLGCQLIIARSFARIHETNLKKQGILPLTFKDPEHYNLIEEGDFIKTLNLKEIESNNDILIQIQKKNGKVLELLLEHTMSNVQLNWFKQGSALNTI